jgi:PadR family transcriptional regulator PadR
VAVDRRTSKLVQGTVDLLILKTLTRGPQHGYGVSVWIRERTGGELSLEDAALYQALHRLESRGLLESEWGVSDNNRRAKYYKLTTLGRQRMRDEAASWNRLADAMAAALRATSQEI